MVERDHLILTAVGPDQVGLVQRLSKFISGCGCNIEDSKMAVFCGEFAIILLISGDKGTLLNVNRDHPRIELETGLSIRIKSPATRRAAEFFLPYKVIASCMDHPGVVHQISAVLSSLGINIESMETSTYSAPVSGTPLFQLEAHVSIPTRTDINHLQERLDQLQREENIDIELVAAKA
jgi:glycine cleavage system transcriptional repressor